MLLHSNIIQFLDIYDPSGSAGYGSMKKFYYSMHKQAKVWISCKDNLATEHMTLQLVFFLNGIAIPFHKLCLLEDPKVVFVGAGLDA